MTFQITLTFAFLKRNFTESFNKLVQLNHIIFFAKYAHIKQTRLNAALKPLNGVVVHCCN